MKMFTVITLDRDLYVPASMGHPAVLLKAGSQGTVVEELTGGWYLAEFCDDEGRTIAFIKVRDTSYD